MFQDCDKKVTEYAKSAASAQRELETMKKQLGIVGGDVKKELRGRTSHLSEVYENVVANIKPLEKAIQYYATFSRHVAGVEYTLQLLSHVIGKNYGQRGILFLASCGFASLIIPINNWNSR